MIKYVPFLKFKQNEIQSLGTLSKSTGDQIRPLFDIPRTSENQTADEILKRLELGCVHLEKIFKQHALDFYVDNFDLNDGIELFGQPQYRYILSALRAHKPIPVLAFDRSADHNQSCIDYLKAGNHHKAAIRLQEEDVESYAITRGQLKAAWQDLHSVGITEIDLIIDIRVISSATLSSEKATKFLTSLLKEFSPHEIAVTGSTIPSNITQLIGTSTIIHLPRQELIMWRRIKAAKGLERTIFGDYGVVSPDYSDAEIDPKLLRRVSTPKVFYTYEDRFFVVRGNSFQLNPAGNGQYFTIADVISGQSFFRPKNYSFGESYIFDRSKASAKLPDKAGTPGSWLKATLASHITFTVNSV